MTFFTFLCLSSAEDLRALVSLCTWNREVAPRWLLMSCLDQVLLQTKRGHILPVCCERHSSPRLSTFCTSRSPPWHKQVLDIRYEKKYLGYPLFETPSDTTSQSRCWRPTWTWWRWTSSMCSTGTSSMTRPFHTSPKNSPTWGGSQAIKIDEPAFPSKMGSFDHKLAVYTQQDIAEIIEYWL